VSWGDSEDSTACRLQIWLFELALAVCSSSLLSVVGQSPSAFLVCAASFSVYAETVATRLFSPIVCRVLLRPLVPFCPPVPFLSTFGRGTISGSNGRLIDRFSLGFFKAIQSCLLVLSSISFSTQPSLSSDHMSLFAMGVTETSKISLHAKCAMW
jgi:hypothetical protein